MSIQKSRNKLIKPLRCPANYSELHSLAHIEYIERHYDLNNSVYSLLPATEVLLFALSHRITIATHCIQQGKEADFFKYLPWCHSFMFLLKQVNIAYRKRQPIDKENQCLDFSKSPGCKEFLENIRVFDQSLEGTLLDSLYLDSKKAATSSFSISDSHSLKLFLHEFEIGLSYLENVPFLTSNISEVFDSSAIRNMVIGYEFDGKREGVLIEFRVVHQLQEILFANFNNLLRSATNKILHSDIIQSLDDLINANTLSDVIMECLKTLIVNLEMEDYFAFRNLLGPSSGLQSQNIKKDCFMDAYPAFSQQIIDLVKNGYGGFSYDELKKYRTQSNECYIVTNVIDEALKISDFLKCWREGHMHFPKNLLGGSYMGYGTSSMVGIKDGLKTVRALYLKSIENDCLQDFSKGLSSCSRNEGADSKRLKSSHLIETLTGAKTQNRFQEVQIKAHTS